MTGRELHQEWIGKTARSAVPWKVEERLLEACGHICQGPCGQPIGIGNAYDIDHIVELKDWLGEDHGNRESNLQLLCRAICHKTKSRLSKLARARTAKTRKHLMGRKVSRHPVPGSKASPWAKRYNKELGRWETVRR